MKKDNLKDYVVTIPDFPVPGVMFRDVTSVIADEDGLEMAINALTKCFEGVEFDAIAGIESRGFVFGTPVAYKLHKPFIMIRKKGKLPRDTVEQTYDLEYGSTTIEVHRDDVRPGEKIIIIDDLVATGGSLKAAANLLEKLGANVVKMVCLMELKGLNGRELLKDYDLETVIQYEGK